MTTTIKNELQLLALAISIDECHSEYIEHKLEYLRVQHGYDTNVYAVKVWAIKQRLQDELNAREYECYFG